MINFLSILDKNISCGCSVEVPSNEYLKLMFIWQNKQNDPILSIHYP